MTMESSSSGARWQLCSLILFAGFPSLCALAHCLLPFDVAAAAAASFFFFCLICCCLYAILFS